MYKSHLVIAFLIVRTEISLVVGLTDNCNVFCDVDGCKESISTLSSEYCRPEYISNNVNFTLISDENKAFNPHGKLQINFTSLRKMDECGVKFILYANKSVDADECTNYDFQKRPKEIYTEKVICFVSSNKQYPNSIDIPVQYLFTACYGIEFYLGSGRFVIRNTYLRTNYNRTDIKKPLWRCTYNVSNGSEKKDLHFEVEFKTFIITQATFWLGTIYQAEGQTRCFYENLNESIKTLNISEEYMNSTLAINERYETTVDFVHYASANANYCIILKISDDRCKSNGFRISHASICKSYKPCVYKSKDSGIQIVSGDNFLWFTGIVSFALFIIITSVYLFCTVNISNTRLSTIFTNHQRYKKVNIQILKRKSTPGVIIGKLNTDIVLLYPTSSSEYIMAQMADLRGMLSRVCRCVVYDWHEGEECNRVAEIGGSDWFAEKLRKGCRVVWLDTPTMRSLINRGCKRNFSESSENFDLTQVGDFRDLALAAIYNLAKQDVAKSMMLHHKHFTVKVKEIDNGRNTDDPFVDLSPRTRYLIPRDLKLLCSILSVKNSVLQDNVN